MDNIIITILVVVFFELSTFIALGYFPDVFLLLLLLLWGSTLLFTSTKMDPLIKLGVIARLAT